MKSDFAIDTASMLILTLITSHTVTNKRTARKRYILVKKALLAAILVLSERGLTSAR